MLAEIPVTETQAAMDRCAADLLWEASIDRPPIDAFVLADRLGLVVAHDAGLKARARHARLAPGDRRAAIGTIVVAAEARDERRHFAVAHEIGEAHAHRVFELLGVDPRIAAPTMRESVANAIAGRLLAPTRWLRGLWADADGELPPVKRAFATASNELLARRVLECVRAPTIMTVTDHNRVAWRQWNLSGAAPPRLRLEIDCQRQAHDSGAATWGEGRDEPRSTGGPPIDRVRAWPVHEEGWRREITVTELYGDDADWA